MSDYKFINGNMLECIESLDEDSIDSIITDPPYELNFMGKDWDNAGVSFNKDTWKKCLKVLKPGGYLLAFGGSRTFHRIACAIEDAGFEIKDTIMWLYGTGFPKSMNLGLEIDKRLGNESKVVGSGKSGVSSRAYQSLETTTAGTYQIKEAQNKWKGWGTQLKPSYEPIIVARKPVETTVIDNVLKYGVGGLNIDECRIPVDNNITIENNSSSAKANPNGRYPANTILTYDDTDYKEVCGGFPNTNISKGGNAGHIDKNVYGKYNQTKSNNIGTGYYDGGSAARYFYCAKASNKDRDEGLEHMKQKVNVHPTVKPVDLMQYLVRLVTPENGVVLDPFMGSGSTGKAVMYENKSRKKNYKFIGIELKEEYFKIAKARIISADGDIVEEDENNEVVVRQRYKPKKLF